MNAREWKKHISKTKIVSVCLLTDTETMATEFNCIIPANCAFRVCDELGVRKRNEFNWPTEASMKDFF
jgi:hypothetical protein